MRARSHSTTCWYRNPGPRLGAFATAVAATLLCSTTLAQTRPSVCSPGLQPAPLDFTLANLAGEQIALRSLSGKVVLLNFWATWCVPCRIEIPALNELDRKYRRRGVEIVGINIGESAATVAAYSKTMKIGYVNLLAGDRTDVLRAFDLSVGLPTTIAITRDGNTCRRRVGLTRKEIFEQLITGLL